MLMYGRIWIRLQLCVLVALAMVSCAPSEKNATVEIAKSERFDEPARTAKIALPKEQIIETANTAAREHGWIVGVNNVVAHYDEGNVRWEYAVGTARKAAAVWEDRAALDGLAERSRCLEGHDYQAVLYWHRPPQRAVNLWVLVDRNTGETLRVTEWP